MRGFGGESTKGCSGGDGDSYGDLGGRWGRKGVEGAVVYGPARFKRWKERRKGIAAAAAAEAAGRSSLCGRKAGFRPYVVLGDGLIVQFFFLFFF